MIFGRGRPLLSGLARGCSVDHPKTTIGGCGLFSELLPNSCRDVSVKQNNCTEAHVLVGLDNCRRDHPSLDAAVPSSEYRGFAAFAVAAVAGTTGSLERSAGIIANPAQQKRGLSWVKTPRPSTEQKRVGGKFTMYLRATETSDDSWPMAQDDIPL
uniref:Uncharacterized protein n=1 Tax=Coccidioides posadasii RMSCC 3488 TaxID=454284 RepID=A0A0J6IB82_COCPO|nr:hypothetical protein CPAG_05230 [Coccidioides posadasii RMSCC 3488]